MDLKTFEKLHSKFSKPNLPKEIWDTPEYNKYISAINTSQECSDWFLRTKMEKVGFDYSKYCCLELANQISNGIDTNGEIIYDDPDVILREWEKGEIGIPIHDGGSSMIVISYCPFCGSKIDTK